jgi:hypothetical protein
VDSPTSRTLTSAASWFLQVAAHAEGRLDEAGLGAWNVRDLLGHTSRALATIESYLEADAARDIEVDLVDAAAYYRATQAALADGEAVTQRGRAAGVALGEDPLAALQGLATRVLERVRSAPEHAVMATPFGVMTLEGYLPTRIVELTVHTCDLAAALDLDAAVPTDAAAASFAVLGALAAGQGSAAPALLALTGRRPLPPGYSLM